ncbi:MAG: hypothetical protein KJ057_12960 [Phycisphaerae bacterium]|nr:hypothetical protein [Planctomycetia bacterium]MCL4719374.1 hypothetical protein [Phycisphaerae bacterium]
MIPNPPHAVLKPKELRGLVCPRCGCRHFRVVYTRAAAGVRIMRRRECRQCGRRMTTIEQVSGQAPTSAA